MLGYCTNIHPGESFADIAALLQHEILDVRIKSPPHEPLPVGLRLSAAAAASIGERERAWVAEHCAQHNLIIPSLNGFPYGAFHATRVKEQVYQPDWRAEARVAYSVMLARLLGVWLPPGITGSVSTVPLGFRTTLPAPEMARVRTNLTRALEGFDQVRQRTGKPLVLALEPEPGCWLESTTDVVAFFETLKLPASLRSALAVCFDCCHHAIAFEEPATSFAALAQAGIAVAKVQVSSALRVVDGAHQLLRPFAEPRYLHQVVARTPDGLFTRYLDLEDALRTAPQTDAEWRVHFHVPVHLADCGGLGTTQSWLQQALAVRPAEAFLEVETYTWSSLPKAARQTSVTATIIQELEWVRRQMDATHRGA